MKRQFEERIKISRLTITNGLAQRIRKLTNGDPYRVEFLGDRLYIDVNREKNCRCEVPQETEIHFEKLITQQFHNLLKKSALTIDVVIDLFSYLTSMEKAIIRQI